MLVLSYINWAGTSEEFKEFADQVKTISNEIEGVSLVGVYIPTSEWHYVVVWNVNAYEKVLQALKAYSEKYGRIKISLGKIELLHTLEEIPFL